MKDIYEKLEIPEPSINLEDKIIAAARPSAKQSWFPKLAVIAACLLVVLMVSEPNGVVEQTPENYSSNYLDDVDFFDEQFGFYEDIS